MWKGIYNILAHIVKIVCYFAKCSSYSCSSSFFDMIFCTNTYVMGNQNWCENTLLEIRIALLIEPEISSSYGGIFYTF